MGTRRSRQQWASELDELARTGEAVESFCRRRGIRRSTLYWWKWKLASVPRRSPPSAAIRLLPVTVAPRTDTAAIPGGVVLEVAGVRVHVETGTDVAYVVALVDALRQRC
jgi:hypothetical protein